MPTPAYEKDNDFTRLDAQVREINRGKGNTRSMATFNTAEPPPGVQTPAMREVTPPRLPPEEIERLNRLAAEHGVEGFEAVTEEAPAQVTPRPVTRELVKTRSILPDFANFESIDLVKKAVIVDGVEFHYDEADQAKLERFCMSVVRQTLARVLTKPRRRKARKPKKSE